VKYSFISSLRHIIVIYEGYWESSICYFRQLNVGAGERARAYEVASHDSLSCKLSHNRTPNVCSCLYRVMTCPAIDNPASFENRVIIRILHAKNTIAAEIYCELCEAVYAQNVMSQLYVLHLIEVIKGYHLEESDVDGKVILKRILIMGCEMWTRFIWFRLGSSRGIFELGTEASDCIKSGGFVVSRPIINLSSRTVNVDQNGIQLCKEQIGNSLCPKQM
jgi:hypothetical protein